MTTTRVDVIDRSVEKTHIWLKDLAEELAADDGHHAYRVLRAFLHALAEQLLGGIGTSPHPGSGPDPDARTHA